MLGVGIQRCYLIFSMNFNINPNQPYATGQFFARKQGTRIGRF